MKNLFPKKAFNCTALLVSSIQAIGITWCQNCFVPLGTIDKKQNTASQLLNKPLNKVIFDHLVMFY